MKIYNWYTNAENCVAPLIAALYTILFWSCAVPEGGTNPSLELVYGGDEDNKRSYRDDCCTASIRSAGLR